MHLSVYYSYFLFCELLVLLPLPVDLRSLVFKASSIFGRVTWASQTRHIFPVCHSSYDFVGARAVLVVGSRVQRV